MPDQPVEPQPVEDSAPVRGSRLGADDWLDAAVEVLLEDGIGGLKISRLSSRLGVTKGSFYWHFTDIATMKSELADHCRKVQAAAVTRLANLEELPPVERIEGMAGLISDPRRWRMEAAMRRWAETDGSIADSIAELDGQIFQISHQAMRELGFDEAEAHARATTLLYAGIGFVHAHGRLGEATADDLRIFLDILTRK
ncbi:MULTISPECIES: TetR/AcrR family transcriptional regulator [Gordonia]|jgi:AcrR family transcriptional regulator|uniref:TetR/AcrR family transcriptional regulator n=2 Tax=Gordoniaceae TaxID=85026 RepID=UPI000553A8A9|nr:MULTISPECIES: TetR/AcrR family transcriptional regulator [Gordonia]AZZ81925.1 TetR/AcrR family transcriptional regulator [Gordonia alkanivorans]MDH3006345.1 TetR/AcrR family transcriptional regulator [Gordonia alkanivorans]MDH3009660.1 TetR/AcrR family transcriptional regulator [Gordonia alkanivorans]MDH3014103.1 TetR/AcrR family transcriptional regulator [Gordonia alkanivorans]MDH3018793.1 TetR/AcrR family transcriptional regulator [Gordonia alkanivorans]